MKRKGSFLFMWNKRKKYEVKEKSENFERCLGYVLWLLNRREYSEKEILDKLIEKKYHPNDQKKVIEYIKEKKYQSDERYGNWFIRNKKIGNKKIKYELKQKGLSEDLIETLLPTKEEEKERIEEIFSKKFKSKSLEDQKDKEKAIRYMLSKGYNYSDFKHLIFK